jgi:hypothetical protein
MELIWWLGFGLLCYAVGMITQYLIDKIRLDKKVLTESKKVMEGFEKLVNPLIQVQGEIDEANKLSVAREYFCDECGMTVYTSTGTCWQCGKDLK